MVAPPNLKGRTPEKYGYCDIHPIWCHNSSPPNLQGRTLEKYGYTVIRDILPTWCHDSSPPHLKGRTPGKYVYVIFFLHGATIVPPPTKRDVGNKAGSKKGNKGKLAMATKATKRHRTAETQTAANVA